jgi:hypothetical protein
MGQGTQFAWQHDARLVQSSQGGMGSNEEMTLFNDNRRGHPSEGMVLRLNTTADTAALVRAYHHHPSLHANIMGSVELLSNGNALVGWGSAPYFSEYSKSGARLLDVKWPGIDFSYRALLTTVWVGTPYYPPRGAVRGKTVYASWNGATHVAKWQVLAGSNAHHLKVVAAQRRTGFETAIALRKHYGVYKVRAVNAHGQTLRTSKAFS